MDTSYCLHGFTITSYFRSSLAAADGKRPPASTATEATIGRRHVVQLGPCWRTRSGHIDQRWLGRPSGHAGPTLPSASCQGMAWGFLQGDSWRGVRCGRFVSCREVGARHFLRLGVTLPEMECSGFRQSRPGRAVGQDQSERPILVTTTLRGGPCAAGPIKV